MAVTATRKIAVKKETLAEIQMKILDILAIVSGATLVGVPIQLRALLHPMVSELSAAVEKISLSA